jgi:colanic acid/amylovoran biosynthesis glycosyltransferase
MTERRPCGTLGEMKHVAYIAFVTNYFPSLSETFIYNEVAKLRERGIQIRTFSVRKPESDSISMESRHLYDSTTYLLPANVMEVTRAHIGEFLRSPSNYLNCLRFLLSRRYGRPMRDRLKTLFHFAEGVYLTRLLRRDAGAIHIHAHYASHPSTISFVASRLTGIQFSFTAHADDIVLEGLMLREKVRESKFVITCSGYGKRMLLRTADGNATEKVFTVYHGIDSRKFAGARAECRNSQFTFLHVGRLSPEKAQDRIVEACALLRERGFDFVCLIVGEGPLREGIARLIRTLKVGENVKLIGRVFQEEMAGYYLRADAFVLSSIRENLPNVLLESLAAGTPVVAPRIGGIEELVQDGVNGLLVEPGDAAALSAAMQRMMVDDGNRVRMAYSGQRVVRERFDREQCIDRLIEVYAAHGLTVPECQG